MARLSIGTTVDLRCDALYHICVEVAMDLIPICRSAVGMDVHLNMIEVCAIVEDASGEAPVHRRRFGGFRRDRLWVGAALLGVALMVTVAAGCRESHGGAPEAADNRSVPPR